MARFTPFTWSYTASTPQKHPPANTAVSSVAPLVSCASNAGAVSGPSVEREAPFVSFAANRTKAIVRTASMAAKLGRERLILFSVGDIYKTTKCRCLFRLYMRIIVAPTGVCERATSLHLGQGQHVPIRILEPCHLGPAWRAPDPELVLFQPRITLELYSLLLKPVHGLADIAHAPAQDGERSGFVIRDS